MEELIMLNTYFLPKLWDDLVLDTPNSPNMNLYNKDDKTVVMELFIPGFVKDEVDILLEKNILKISGARAPTDRQYFHQEEFLTSFKKTVSLEKNLEISNVILENGVLSIELVRNVPEEEKPKKILIQ
jgi:molecular chaperone IbpA